MEFPARFAEGQGPRAVAASEGAGVARQGSVVLEGPVGLRGRGDITVSPLFYQEVVWSTRLEKATSPS